MGMESNQLNVFSVNINDLEEDLGITIMSLVEEPAVESNFLMFKKADVEKLSFNKEKRWITGVALRADFPILRLNGNEEYYLEFSKENIQKIMEKFMKERLTNKVNIQHKEDVEGIFLVESFILNKEHKLSYPEFNDINEGSWMVTYKIENEEVWKDIQEGKIKGFSVEMNANFEPKKNKSNRLEKLSRMIKFLNLIENEVNN